MEAFPPAGVRGRLLVRDDGDRAGGDGATPGGALARGEPDRRGESLGAYRTDFYPTYDYKAVAEQEHKKAREVNGARCSRLS